MGRLNIDEVVHLASSNATKTRVFAVGVGEGVSRHSIHSLSRVGGGSYSFVSNNETPFEIRKKMTKIVSQSVQGVLTNVSIINIIIVFLNIFNFGLD